MVDREKVLAVLRRRFPGATDAQTAAAANAIVGLDDEWREVECTDLGAAARAAAWRTRVPAARAAARREVAVLAQSIPFHPLVLVTGGLRTSTETTALPLHFETRNDRSCRTSGSGVRQGVDL